MSPPQALPQVQQSKLSEPSAELPFLPGKACACVLNFVEMSGNVGK